MKMRVIILLFKFQKPQKDRFKPCHNINGDCLLHAKPAFTDPVRGLNESVALASRLVNFVLLVLELFLKFQIFLFVSLVGLFLVLKGSENCKSASNFKNTSLLRLGKIILKIFFAITFRSEWC